MDYDRETLNQFFTKILQDLQDLKSTFKQNAIDKNIVGKEFREAFKVEHSIQNSHSSPIFRHGKKNTRFVYKTPSRCI